METIILASTQALRQ